jgi:hypothetical protein
MKEIARDKREKMSKIAINNPYLKKTLRIIHKNYLQILQVFIYN